MTAPVLDTDRFDIFNAGDLNSAKVYSFREPSPYDEFDSFYIVDRRLFAPGARSVAFRHRG